MSSFHGNFSRWNFRSTTYNNYRYPSYLLKVAPPEVYSYDDIRNMLVPKTYETKKVSSIVTSHSHIDVLSTKSLVEFKDAESTKRNFNVEKTSNKTTDGHRRRNNASVSKIDNVPLSRQDSAGNQRVACKTNTNNGKTAYHERLSYKTLKIHKPIVVDETKKGKNCRITPTDSGYMSKNNSLTLVSDNIKINENCTQIRDEQNEDCVFYDYDDQENEQNVIQKPSEPRFSEKYGIDDIKFVQMCKKCHKTWPLDGFAWENFSETDKSQLIEMINDETDVSGTSNYCYNEPDSQ